MKKVKLVALLLALCLMMSCFAGCAPAETQPAGNDGDQSNQGDQQDQTPPEKEELDFTGVKIKALCYENNSQQNEAVAKKINEELGFEIEWVVCPASEGWNAVDRLLAADPTIDMMYVSFAKMQEFISKGYLMDISSYIGDERFPNIQEWNVPLMDGTTGADGKTYGFPLISLGGYNATNGSGIAIREDWLKEAGLELPETIEDLDKVLEAFKARDPSKYPLFESAGTLAGTTGAMFARCFSEAGYGWWQDTDGTLKHWIQHPDFKKFVEKKKEWYDKGYLHPEFVTANTQATTQLMSSGDVGVVAAWCTNPINPNVALMEEDPNARFVFMKGTVTGPAGGGILGGPPVGSCMVVNVNSKNADACVKALDYFESAEGTRLATLGVEGVNYNLEDGLVVKEEGDNNYGGQFNAYTCQPHLITLKTGTHYTDTQYYNWYDIFYSEERKEQLYYEPDVGLVYDYGTGDNKYSELGTVANTYIGELVVNMVTGKESLDNWDTKVKELEEIALNQMVKERNEQWAKYDKRVYEPGDLMLDLDTKPAWMDDFTW